MNQVVYTTIEAQRLIDGTVYTVYGIAAYRLQNSTDNAHEPERRIAFVEDISTDRAETDALAELCNRLELAPQQLREVAEDFTDR